MVRYAVIMARVGMLHGGGVLIVRCACERVQHRGESLDGNGQQQRQEYQTSNARAHGLQCKDGL